MNNYILIILTTSAIFFILIKLANPLGLLDKPSSRKKHKFNTPNIGGLGIYIVLLILLKIYDFDRYLTSVIIASFGIALIGVLDDKYYISLTTRLLVQISCVFYLVYNGFIVYNLGEIYPIGILTLGSFSIIFTSLCLIFIINSFNYLDGIDGSLGAISLISILTLNLFIYYTSGTTEIILNNLVIILLIFLFFNLSNNKISKTFLGNSGSYLLGFIIGSFGIYYVYILNLITAEFFIWVVAFPVFEFLSTNLSRIIRRRNIFKPGRDHIHYIIDKNQVRSLIKITLIHILFIIFGLVIYLLKFTNFSIYIYIITFFSYFSYREQKLQNKII